MEEITYRFIPKGASLLLTIDRYWNVYNSQELGNIVGVLTLVTFKDQPSLVKGLNIAGGRLLVYSAKSRQGMLEYLYYRSISFVDCLAKDLKVDVVVNVWLYGLFLKV